MAVGASKNSLTTKTSSSSSSSSSSSQQTSRRVNQLNQVFHVSSSTSNPSTSSSLSSTTTSNRTSKHRNHKSRSNIKDQNLIYDSNFDSFRSSIMMVSNAIHHHQPHHHHHQQQQQQTTALNQLQNHHHHHQQQQHHHSSMLTTHSYYAAAAAAAALVHHNPTTQHHSHQQSAQLLVHHPDYHQVSTIGHNNNNSNNHNNNNNNNNHHRVPTQYQNGHFSHQNGAVLIDGGGHFQTATNVVASTIANNNLNNNNDTFDNFNSTKLVSSSSSSLTNNATSSNNETNNGQGSIGTQVTTVATEIPPDRPIGYGAFGVVWSVTDPRDGKRVALKKMPNVFQNLISSKRVFREMKMLCFFKHENVLSALDILQPPNSIAMFNEIYVITELMESDLHKIIVSSQPLTPDHIKVFLYQILRGLKYLHSAKILHRDIKPGNLLVNSNCLLKICDFGLARIEERDRSRKMTQEVVTQYYRAPELLMGAKYYTEAIDMWSVGCIFAELLGRRILFQAQTPIQQLELIIDLLGTPSHEDMRYACDAARLHVLRQGYKSHRLSSLSKLSSHTTNEAVHLLCQMLTFNPDKRVNCATALNHPYLSEGRARYHSCMCKCCYTVGDSRRYCSDPEPTSLTPFDNSFEKELTSLQVVKARLYKEIMQKCMSSNRVPLCINPMSASFKNFANSTVAHPSELPPSPHCWE